ncbi:MAG: VOC family protein [Bacteroidota bacterium]
MTTTNKSFSHAATILPVRNMDTALHFYCSKLGFDLSFGWNSPIDYAVLKRDGVSIHLSLRQEKTRAFQQHTNIYIFVYEVHQLHQEFERNGVTTLSEPQLHEYGMLDFELSDPDGHILSFGRHEG